MVLLPHNDEEKGREFLPHSCKLCQFIAISEILLEYKNFKKSLTGGPCIRFSSRYSHTASRRSWTTSTSTSGARWWCCSHVHRADLEECQDVVGRGRYNKSFSHCHDYSDQLRKVLWMIKKWKRECLLLRSTRN